MKTVNYTLYSFSELSPAAKEVAVANHVQEAQNCSYILEHQMQEMHQSLEEFATKLFDGLQDYSYGIYCRGANVELKHPTIGDHLESAEREDSDGDEDNEANFYDKYFAGSVIAEALTELHMIGYDIAAYEASGRGTGQCLLTGMCYDEIIIDAFLKELDGELEPDYWERRDREEHVEIIEQKMRGIQDSICSAICETLESEYGYLTSEEYAVEYLSGDTDEIFTEEGNTH
tara:strand:- start:7232 stop:7924 length:693 start_codon:yes stop_codon:yes gene_type:complete